MREIRTLLADSVGGEAGAPMCIRAAAHMAYALQNEAEAAYTNADYQPEHAIRKITAIDEVLGVSDGAALLSRLEIEATLHMALNLNDRSWPRADIIV